MATFEDIAKANAQIHTIEVNGKNYAEVNQRIKAFRMVHPNGGIETAIVSDQNGRCVIAAKVTDEAGNILGTGTAYEKEGSNFVNKFSYIENCETSAVGRALGMAGFGIDTSVASYEEVANAIKQQDASKPVDKKMAMAFKDRCGGNADLEKYVLDGLKIKAFTELTNEMAASLNANWDKIVKKFEGGK